MRFHHGPRKVKEIIDSGIIGRIFSARMQSRQNHPTVADIFYNYKKWARSQNCECVLYSCRKNPAYNP